MKLVPMRFKGVQWHHNPREIAFVCEKHINELHAPFDRSFVQECTDHVAIMHCSRGLSCTDHVAIMH